MGDVAELLYDGGVEFRHRMAVDVAPETGNAVDVAPAEGVEEEFALAALDDHDVLALDPGLHRGEGMPKELAVPGDELGGGRRRG